MEIKNKELIKTIEMIASKPISKFTATDFNIIIALKLDAIDYENNPNPIIFSELLNFSSLESLNIHNSFITIEDMIILTKLPNLKRLEFYNCAFVDIELKDAFPSLELLSFISCSLANFEFVRKIQSLQTLIINNPLNNSPIDGTFIICLPNLINLDISFSKMKDYQFLLNTRNLEELSIEGVPFDLQMIKSIPSLKEIYLSLEDYQSNKEFINKNQQISFYPGRYTKLLLPKEDIENEFSL